MKLHITGYYQDKYLYSVTREGLIINDKEYGVNKQKHSVIIIISSLFNVDAS